ncbi:MAG: CpaF family protein [Anaerolineae bacterium]|nr:CpaF family protein [Anaerolineae bacterium]
MPARQTEMLDIATVEAKNEERMIELKARIQRQMIIELNQTKKTKFDAEGKETKEDEKEKKPKGPLARPKKESTEQLTAKIRELFDTIIVEDRLMLNRNERKAIYEQIVADILGFGPLEVLLADEHTSDIMVIGHDRIFIEQRGQIYHTNIKFDDEEHLMHIISRILAPLGRRVDETSPMVDARLPDGSRVNAVVRPVALDGPCLTIRKFSAIPFTQVDLIEFGTATEEIFDFLNACVKASLNILVAGGSSCGKTTLLNVLSGYIPDGERVVTLENAAELQLQQEHIVRLETRPENIEGEGEITIRDLVVNSMRMRPDRIIVGEVRSGEAIDLIQAMNSGRDGSMCTLHSNSAKDAISRLEVMCISSGMDLPIRAIREQIASAVDVVIFMSRLRDGTRKIMEIAEVEGLEGDSVMLTNIFAFERTGTRDNKVQGQLRPSGITPRFIETIEDAGIRLSPGMFGLDAYDGQRRPRKEFITVEEEEPESGAPPGEPPAPPPPSFSPMV